jgi:hypothetical protein
MLNCIQAQLLLGQLGQQCSGMAGLIVRQQHIPKVPFQVLLPQLLIAVDGSGPLVGMYPGHIHTITRVRL